MRVLLINQAAYPDVVATAQHSWDLVQALRVAGHEVTIICSRSRYGSAGSAFPRTEVIDGVRMARVGSALFGRSALWTQALDAGGFLLGAIGRALGQPRPDVCICLTTPPFVAAVGWILRRLRGVPYVLWSMDLYPDVPVALGVVRATGAFATILYVIERVLLRGAHRVVVLGRCMRDRMIAKGLPASRIHGIHIWAHQQPEANGTTNFREQWGIGDRLLVVYAGNFGLVHDLEPVRDTVLRLTYRTDICFAFIGEGPLKAGLIDALRASGAANWIEAGYQPSEQLGALLSAADVHLASLRAGFEGLAVPSKVLGAMGAGRPVIYVGAAAGEAARVIAESGGGAVVDNGDTEGLIKSITHFADDRAAAVRAGLRAREAVATQWSASRALQAWVRLVESIPDQHRRGAHGEPVRA